jgi:site-specific DNA-cytosine methylase
MSDLTVIDCQGLGGAWTLGAAQAGFELVHRVSLGAFGDDIVEHNRALLPGPWRQDPGGSVYEWEPAQAGYLIGTPPCSGFSLLNRTKKGPNQRGSDSAINNCMRELVQYAGKCRGADGRMGPEIVSLESVQGAYKDGRGLMQELRDTLERLTGQRYGLTHVLLAGSTIGAAQMRHRYYMVLHRISFGIDPPEKRRVATYRDAIDDLVGLRTDSWDAQDVPYRGDERDWWLNEQNILNPVYWESDGSAGDGQFTSVGQHVEPSNRRLEFLLEHVVPYWPVGQNKEGAMLAYREANGCFPPNTDHWFYAGEDTLKGFNHETRIKPDKPGYVLTGGAVFGFIHYEEPRFLTVRECARLMGYPDAWSFSDCKNMNQASNLIGKCCPVQSGRWIAEWAARALQGNPGAPCQPLDGPETREFYHNNTPFYRPWLKEQELERERVGRDNAYVAAGDELEREIRARKVVS